MTSGKAVGVTADGGDSIDALVASDGVVGLILWSSTGYVTDSSSSKGRGGSLLRVGDDKPSSKKTISGLNYNSPFRVPNLITTSFILATHKETHSRPVVKLSARQWWTALRMRANAQRPVSRHRAPRTGIYHLCTHIPFHQPISWAFAPLWYALARFLEREVYQFRCNTCSAGIKTGYLLRQVRYYYTVCAVLC